MSKNNNILVLGPITATGLGASIPCYDLDINGAGLLVYGTFVGTFTVEVSHNGVDFVAAKAPPNVAIGALTAAAIHVIAGTWSYIRYNCSAYTSGSAYASVAAKPSA